MPHPVCPSDGVCAHKEHCLAPVHAHGVLEVVVELFGGDLVRVDEGVRLGVARGGGAVDPGSRRRV